MGNLLRIPIGCIASGRNYKQIELVQSKATFYAAVSKRPHYALNIQDSTRKSETSNLESSICGALYNTAGNNLSRIASSNPNWLEDTVLLDADAIKFRWLDKRTPKDTVFELRSLLQQHPGRKND